MICEKCKHEIGPEDLKCPYCGADNPFALQHQANMEQFRTAYENTKQEVVQSARKTSGLATRAIILVILLIGCIVTHLISSYNYADHDPEDAVRQDAEKNAASYAKEAEAFLDRGEYTEFMSYLYAHELQYDAPEEFDHLQRVTYVAKNYYECIKLMEEMILRSPDPDYFDGLDTDIQNFCMYLEEFYKTLEAQKSAEKDEVNLAYMEDMELELESAMKTYFSMDDAALVDFLSLSETKKALALVEVLRHD